MRGALILLLLACFSCISCLDERKQAIVHRKATEEIPLNIQKAHAIEGLNSCSDINKAIIAKLDYCSVFNLLRVSKRIKKMIVSLFEGIPKGQQVLRYLRMHYSKGLGRYPDFLVRHAIDHLNCPIFAFANQKIIEDVVMLNIDTLNSLILYEALGIVHADILDCLLKQKGPSLSILYAMIRANYFGNRETRSVYASFEKCEILVVCRLMKAYSSRNAYMAPFYSRLEYLLVHYLTDYISYFHVAFHFVIEDLIMHDPPESVWLDIIKLKMIFSRASKNSLLDSCFFTTRWLSYFECSKYNIIVTYIISYSNIQRKHKTQFKTVDTLSIINSISRHLLSQNHLYYEYETDAISFLTSLVFTCSSSSLGSLNK